MKAKNATPGTPVQHKVSGMLGIISDRPTPRRDSTVVRWTGWTRCDGWAPSADHSIVRLAYLRLARFRRIQWSDLRWAEPTAEEESPGERIVAVRRPNYLLAGLHEDTDPVLADRLRALGAEFGPAIVALTAIGLSDPNYVIARLLDGPYASPYEVVTGRNQPPDDPGPQPGEAPLGEHDPIAAAVGAEFRGESDDGPRHWEAELRVLPMPEDDELLCILRNTGRVVVWMRGGIGGGQMVAVAPDVTVAVPRSWAALPGEAAVRGFTEADEPTEAEMRRGLMDSAWVQGYDACRRGEQPRSPYRKQRPAADG